MVDETNEATTVYMQILALRDMRKEAYKPWHAASLRHSFNERPATRAKRTALMEHYHAVCAMLNTAEAEFADITGMDVYRWESYFAHTWRKSA